MITTCIMNIYHIIEYTPPTPNIESHHEYSLPTSTIVLHHECSPNPHIIYTCTRNTPCNQYNMQRLSYKLININIEPNLWALIRFYSQHIC